MAYYFALPNFTDLTVDQEAALDETESLALAGGPGTGKSVVCLWRHIRNYETNTKKSLLLTYTKTLEHYLKKSADSKSTEASLNVNRTYWWTSHPSIQKPYDEIIIDEGQDVSIDRYRTIINFSNNVSYGADDAQSLYADGCTPEQLADLFPFNEEYTMYKNFRNSKEILEFTRSVFPNILIPQESINQAKAGLKPIMKITGWDSDIELESIMSIINDFQGDTHNIGILVPSQKDVTKYFDLIKDQLSAPIQCTKFEAEMDVFQGLSGIHITTFKSSKGIEFDTVIIPNFDRFDWFIANINHITEKDYYVAFTRTKTNLFLICRNDPHKGDTITFEIE